MACTPRKSVQWSNDNEVNEFVYGSPYSEASSTDSINATSTLQYINSQLVAHGFARGTGVSFEGLSKGDADKLSKCMLGMLSQRNEDMTRAEDLSTKLRTLSYEHERLSSMHRATSEQLAAAERETNLFKSRLTASNKSLQASEASHKATSCELQRARSTMQSVRQTYAAELKRREKETEKMIDRLQKISDAQTKLSSTTSGLKLKTTLANPVVSSRDGEIIGKGPDLLEDALDEAEAARKELAEENTSLKNVVLSAANELSRISHAMHMRTESAEEEEAPRFTLSDIFSISAPESASEKFNDLLTSFQEAVTRFNIDYDPESTTPSCLPPPRSGPQATHKTDGDSHRIDSKELQRLQNTIVDLRRQLEQAQTQKQTGTYADQAQAIIRRFVNDDDEKASVHERQLMEKIRKELDHARKKVDEAALTLKDEKQALNEEKQAFYREQRLWRSQMSIPQDDEGASKPITGLGAYFEAPAEPLELPVSPPRLSRKSKKIKSPKKVMASPRRSAAVLRSPAKPIFAVGKVAKKMRNGGTPRKPSGAMLGASTLRQKVIPPMETEVIPTAPALPTTASSQSLIVPNSFVLPPPSPLASIPPHQPELLSMKPIAAPSFGDAEEVHEESSFSDELELDALQPTPKKLFPVAKPFAQHMIHAYSPAHPSPLSRILLLSNSPAQSMAAPEGGGIDAPFSSETGEEGAGHGASSSSGSGGSGSGPARAMLLEEELGIEDLISASDESPLRAKNMRLASKTRNTAKMNSGVKDRAKPKMSALRGSAKPPGRETDKENGVIKTGRVEMQPPPPVAKQSTTAKPLLTGKGGARRVPIGSVDAAPIGPGWK